MRIYCPCCGLVRVGLDVWYDCTCFSGAGRKDCKNCEKPRADRDAGIAANIRLKGWDKNPSPGMLDYLTPGWR